MAIIHDNQKLATSGARCGDVWPACLAPADETNRNVTSYNNEIEIGKVLIDNDYSFALIKFLDKNFDKKTFANLLPDGDLKNFMLNNIKSYMRKSFATFSNPEYMASDKLKSSASKWILENVVKKNKDIRESALKELKTKNMTDGQALQEMAESLTNKI